MRYANTLIPGVLFVASGIRFAIYAHKTDSKSQKIAAYLLAATAFGYGITQIVDYLYISSCIGKEISSRKFEFENMVKNESLHLVPDSFKVNYNPTTQQPEYSFTRYPEYSFNFKRTRVVISTSCYNSNR